MGIPIGWSSPEPLAGLTWLDWSVDPADGEANERHWLTPSTVDIAGGDDRIEKRTEYRKLIGRHYVPGCLSEQVNVWMYPTARANDWKDGGWHNGDRNGSLSGCAKLSNGSGFIPRVTIVRKNRVSRLKGLGNAQVPLCMATAWRLLTEGDDETK